MDSLTGTHTGTYRKAADFDLLDNTDNIQATKISVSLFLLFWIHIRAHPHPPNSLGLTAVPFTYCVTCIPSFEILVDWPQSNTHSWVLGPSLNLSPAVNEARLYQFLGSFFAQLNICKANKKNDFFPRALCWKRACDVIHFSLFVCEGDRRKHVATGMKQSLFRALLSVRWL